MLTPHIFTTEFYDFIKSYISLNDDLLPLYESDGKTITPSVGDYPSKFADAYDTYSLSGEVLGAIHGPSQTPIALENFLRTFSYNPMNFAIALATFWSTVLIDPGPPAHGGISVVSVVNDAMSHVDKFYTAIITSYTTSLVLPVFSNLINNIETIALPNVTWYVTELVHQGGGSYSPVVFPEKVV